MNGAAGAGFSAEDHAQMARALQLAARGLASTPPNPSVGCVLLDAGGTVVGEGWHERTGEPHAEVHALRTAAGRERGGTAYVTLEPCSHHGRTPPCADALVASGVRRVVVAMSDPNPRVAGTGVARLQAAGIGLSVGLLESPARELNRGFVARMTRGRPWLTVKLGASLDGRTALADGASQWITGPQARADVQRLRARASAILTGAGTVRVDNPSLTVRDPTLQLRGRRPLRVVCDASGAIPVGAKLLCDGAAPTLILTANEAVQTARVAASGVEYLPVALSAADRLDPATVLAVLAQRECNEVLLEAGPTLAGSFLEAGLVDELVVYVAPTVLGDAARPLFTLPRPLQDLAQRRRFAFHDVRQLGADLRLTLRPEEA